MKHERVIVKTFQAGKDFQALYDAGRFLMERGFTIGPMQRGANIGVQREYTTSGISKWRGMTMAERAGLDGVLASNDFKSLPVVLWMYPDTEGVNEMVAEEGDE